MFCQQCPLLTKLDCKESLCLVFVGNCMPIQPQSIITNQVPTPNPNVVPYHYVEKKVVKAAASQKKNPANTNIPIQESVVENFPPLLQNSEGALNILANNLEVQGELPLQSSACVTLVWTNRQGPLQISIVTN
jgi:hypothetical protein